MLDFKDFDKYVDWARYDAPEVTIDDLTSIYGESGQIIEMFVSGQIGKDEFVRRDLSIADKYHVSDRSYYFEVSADLEAALFFYTTKRKYAAEQRIHEEEHATQFSEFVSSSGKTLSGTVYSVKITSDGYITPYACPYLKKKFKSPIECAREHSMYGLDERSLREYFAYLRWAVLDPSAGDRLILGI